MRVRAAVVVLCAVLCCCTFSSYPWVCQRKMSRAIVKMSAEVAAFHRYGPSQLAHCWHCLHHLVYIYIYIVIKKRFSTEIRFVFVLNGKLPWVASNWCVFCSSNWRFCCKMCSGAGGGVGRWFPNCNDLQRIISKRKKNNNNERKPKDRQLTAWNPFSSATYCTEMIVPSGASYEYEPLCTIISAASSSPVLLPSACNRGTNTFLWYPFVCCFIWLPVSKL